MRLQHLDKDEGTQDVLNTGDAVGAEYTEPTPEELVKSITLSLPTPSSSPRKKGGQSKFQLEKQGMAVSKSTGALPNTRGILKVGDKAIDNGRGRNTASYDILKQSMTLKEPLDGSYGEAYIKLKVKQNELPPVTPVTAIVQDLAAKDRSSA